MQTVQCVLAVCSCGVGMAMWWINMQFNSKFENVQWWKFDHMHRINSDLLSESHNTTNCLIQQPLSYFFCSVWAQWSLLMSSLRWSHSFPNQAFNLLLSPDISTSLPVCSGLLRHPQGHSAGVLSLSLFLCDFMPAAFNMDRIAPRWWMYHS